MSEHIISDEFIKGVRDASYEEGKAGLESYIVVLEDNEEVIRCRDCAYWIDEDYCTNPKWRVGRTYERPCTEPDGFCAWAERRQA